MYKFTIKDGPLTQPTLEQAIELAKEKGKISMAEIQRYLHCGYSHACELYEQLDSEYKSKKGEQND